MACEATEIAKRAIALVALCSMLSSLISAGFSLIFSGVFVRELSKHVKGMDYRAAGAAGYLGLGAVWALGPSSSAAMLMGTRSSLPASLLNISGVIPLRQTIFLWQSIATAAILTIVSTLIAYFSAPPPEYGTAEYYNIESAVHETEIQTRTRPGEWLSTVRY